MKTLSRRAGCWTPSHSEMLRFIVSFLALLQVSGQSSSSSTTSDGAEEISGQGSSSSSTTQASSSSAIVEQPSNATESFRRISTTRPVELALESTVMFRITNASEFAAHFNLSEFALSAGVEESSTTELLVEIKIVWRVLYKEYVDEDVVRQDVARSLGLNITEFSISNSSRRLSTIDELLSRYKITSLASPNQDESSLQKWDVHIITSPAGLGGLSERLKEVPEGAAAVALRLIVGEVQVRVYSRDGETSLNKTKLEAGLRTAAESLEGVDSKQIHVVPDEQTGEAAKDEGEGESEGDSEGEGESEGHSEGESSSGDSVLPWASTAALGGLLAALL